MQLPQSNDLPVHLLAACFNNTSATYKYYWLLAILQEIEEEHTTIVKQDLFARMISNAWYTVNYFRVSFGKQDLIQDTIKTIYTFGQIQIDENPKAVFEQLKKSPIKAIQAQLWHFDKNVPHWFLSPWFTGSAKPEIYAKSSDPQYKALYALQRDKIIINPIWVAYLKSNSKLLKDFCCWNLALFLQSKNPSVPDIPNKILKPLVRKTLTQQRTQFWDIVMAELGSIPCIYTGEQLTKGHYAVEHFIPHSFVSHDLMWNLIPANKSFNSSKGDKLPPLPKYFEQYFEVQKMALGIIKEHNSKNKFLQDYLTILPDYDASFTHDKLLERVQPLILIASNNGFEYMK